MRKYLPNVIQQMTSPPIQMQTSILSPSRFFHKRSLMKECKKIYDYHHEDDIDREIATAYFGLRDAIQSNNSPMTLRYLSINLYEQYLANPQCFKIEEGISDVSILDCAKVKNEATGISWFHMEVVIKHFKVKHSYGLERRIYSQNYHFQNTYPRKWYFNKLPINY